MTRVVTLYRWRDRLYRVHMVTGLAAAVWFLLMALTGILINHQESLGLLDAEVSDRYLPGYYRSDARTGTTRLNIIITDLHSGRILGAQGAWMSDLVAVLLIVSLLSGYLSNRMKKGLQAANSRQIVQAAASNEGKESQWDASGSRNGSTTKDSETSREPSGKRVTAR